VKTEHSRRTKEDGNLNNSAFPRILELAREEELMSLDRLGAGARSVDLECSKEVGDRGITSFSEATPFQQSRERQLVVRMIAAAPDNARSLIHLANGEGIWILSHQQVLRRYLCGSSDAISSVIPNCD
jgi:hypothetical protein